MSSIAETGREDAAESYEAVQKAVMETERGRRFLAEYAKRQRTNETASVLDALKRLETVIAPSVAVQPSPEALQYMQLAARELLSRSEAIRKIAAALEHPDIQHRLSSEADALRLVALNHDLFRHRFAGFAPPSDPTPEQLKYFADDEDEFEAPSPAIATRFRPAPPAQPGLASPPIKNRIVLIRHAAGEEPVIPLQSDFAAAG